MWNEAPSATARAASRLLTFMLATLVAVGGLAAPAHARASASPDTEPIVGFWGEAGYGPGIRITVAGGGYHGYFLSGTAPCGGSRVGLVDIKLSGSGLSYSGASLWYRYWNGCQIAYGKATMSLTDATHGQFCGTDPDGERHFCWTLVKTENYTGVDWSQFFDNAESDWDYAAKNGKGSAAYYRQILNLICAATRSGRTSCAPMTGKYAGYKWSGQWTADVFKYFLSESNQDKRHTEIDKATKAADGVEQNVEKVCDFVQRYYFGKTMCNMVRPIAWSENDERAAVAGAIHFAQHLQPGFYQATLNELSKYHNDAGYKIGIEGLREEHEELFKYAVIPGFDALVKSGDMSAFAAAIAKKAVPDAATVYREYNILAALITLNGLRGIEIYNKNRMPEKKP